MTCPFPWTALCKAADASKRRIAELEPKLSEAPKTPDNSGVPPSKGHKANQQEKAKRQGLPRGSLGRTGGGYPLARDPDSPISQNITAYKRSAAPNTGGGLGADQASWMAALGRLC
jgi:hypothetical protein